MYSLNQVKTLALCGRDPARSLPLRRGFLLIPLILLCFAFAPQIRAISPPPDGCYPNFNTAEGCNALLLNSAGAGNTGIGWYSIALGDGSYNTGCGGGSLALNNGDSNTAVGAAALLLNTSGFNNTATGTDCMVFNDSGVYNNAVGAFSLYSNVDGFSNNALGESALKFNVTAAANTAIGDVALAVNDSDGAGLGNNNVAVGAGALAANVDGSENTAVGTGAGPDLINGFNNTYVGNFVGSVDENGDPLADEDSTIRIGDLSNGNGAGSLQCYIGGIFNNEQPVGGTVVAVTIDLANDHLGFDPGAGGKAPAVRRGAPARRSPMQPAARPALQRQTMLNDKVETLQAKLDQQQKQIETLTTQLSEQAKTFTAQLKEQASQIQKVSAQLEMVKPAPRVVENR